MAVNEMLQWMNGFRAEATDNHLGLDRVPGHKPRHGCPMCATDELWDAGDVEPFLGRIG